MDIGALRSIAQHPEPPLLWAYDNAGTTALGTPQLVIAETERP